VKWTSRAAAAGELLDGKPLFRGDQRRAELTPGSYTVGFLRAFVPLPPGNATPIAQPGGI
jgi:hypothetical protein